MILADKIILERKKNGWSQEELADKLGVTRQAVSKWEGAQATPDIQRLLEMSKLFNVTVDYLIKDEMETSEITVDNEAQDSAKRVSMEEANEFLRVKRETAPKIAIGVLLCILSPIAMILLCASAEGGYINLSEDLAGGIGIIILIFIVAIACGIFVACGAKTKKYQFYEKEIIDTAYGVSGMVKERKEEYSKKYTAYNIIGIIMCFVGAATIFAGGFFDDNDYASAIFLCLAIFVVAIGVYCFVVVGINDASFDKLLQEGDYTIENKTSTSLVSMISTIYWLLVTAVFLCIGFYISNWKACGLIWPIAGVIYPVVVIFVKIYERK